MSREFDKWERKKYTAELAANIRAARSRAGMSQKSLAKRMRELGFSWAYQTVGKVENDNRPLLAAELLGLALALNVTLPYLTTVSEEDHFVEVSPDIAIGSVSVRRLAMGVPSEYTRTIEWDDEDGITAWWVYSTREHDMLSTSTPQATIMYHPLGAPQDVGVPQRVLADAARRAAAEAKGDGE